MTFKTSNFTNIRPGDEVVVSTMVAHMFRQYRVVPVERATPTLFVVEGIRFQKKSGDPVGGQECRIWVHPATPLYRRLAELSQSPEGQQQIGERHQLCRAVGSLTPSKMLAPIVEAEVRGNSSHAAAIDEKIEEWMMLTRQLLEMLNVDMTTYR